MFQKQSLPMRHGYHKLLLEGSVHEFIIIILNI